jgi:phosphatidylglycerol:prolipoprotein diacylglycerol transferase
VPAATITIGLDPLIDVGPLRLSWHGLMIAVGLLVGATVAAGRARRIGIDGALIWVLAGAVTVAGMVGARVVFLAENEPAELVDPGAWFGTRGYAFYGGLIGGGLAAALLLRHWRLPAAYLDALAYGFPLGMAVGRIGDVINGEHFGPPTDAPWGIQYTHPDAEVPTSTLAYHAGGLYEVVLALALAAFVLLVGRRLRPSGALLWSVVGLYAAGRFVMFFYRDDSETLAAGLNGAQWISVALVVASAVGLFLALQRATPTRSSGHPSLASRP